MTQKERNDIKRNIIYDITYLMIKHDAYDYADSIERIESPMTFDDLNYKRKIYTRATNYGGRGNRLINMIIDYYDYEFGEYYYRLISENEPKCVDITTARATKLLKPVFHDVPKSDMLSASGIENNRTDEHQNLKMLLNPAIEDYFGVPLVDVYFIRKSRNQYGYGEI